MTKNKRPSRPGSALAACLLVSTVFAIVAAADPAAAHDCRGVNPGQTCGDCREGAHNHRYAHDDSLYCESGGGGGEPIPACYPRCLARVR